MARRSRQVPDWVSLLEVLYKKEKQKKKILIWGKKIRTAIF